MTLSFETPCPAREDRAHCRHWWDDTGPCCACADDTDAGARDGGPVIAEPAP